MGTAGTQVTWLPVLVKPIENSIPRKGNGEKRSRPGAQRPKAITERFLEAGRQTASIKEVHGKNGRRSACS